jgi:predicted nucleic acid-binding protein
MGRSTVGCGGCDVRKTSYLADTSAWTNFHKSLDSERRWTQLVTGDQIEMTEPVRLELLRSARSYAEFANLTSIFDAFRPAPVNRDIWKRAMEVFDLLAQRGTHRGVSMADLLVAASAEHFSSTVLHYDKDFELIAGVTGQPTQWIAPRGSL